MQITKELEKLHSTLRKYSNHTLQTNPQCHAEEMQIINSHKKTSQVKQPATL